MVQHCFLLPNNIAPPFLFYVYLCGILTKKKKRFSWGGCYTSENLCSFHTWAYQAFYKKNYFFYL